MGQESCWLCGFSKNHHPDCPEEAGTGKAFISFRDGLQRGMSLVSIVSVNEEECIDRHFMFGFERSKYINCSKIEKIIEQLSAPRLATAESE